MEFFITHLNLKLQKFDILCCFLQHRTNVNLSDHIYVRKEFVFIK